ncbi:energy transducer TonB [Salegentibacter sp. HM20]
MKYLTIFILMLVFPTLQSQEKQASGKIVPFQQIEYPPVFPGCENENEECTSEKVIEFIQSKINYNKIPSEFSEIKISLKLILNEKGKIKWQKISTDPSNLQEEINSIVEEMPQFSVAEHNNEPVNAMFNLNFKIKLPSETQEKKIPNYDTPPIAKGCENSENKKKCLSEYLQEHILKNFRPKSDKKGQFYTKVSFSINEKGEVSDIIAKGENTQINKQARELIQNLPRLKPATFKGNPVTIPYELPIWGEVN